MSKGDIILIPFPFTDLSGQKIRPALVLSANNKSEDFIVAFISSTKPKKLNEFNIKITPSKTNGLKTKSTIRIDKIATLQKEISLGELGKTEPATMKLVNQKLKNLFDL